VKQKGRKDQRKGTILLFLILFLLLTPVAVWSIMRGVSHFSNHIDSNPSDQNLVKLWNSKDYETILFITEQNLDSNPMEPYSLLFFGLSSYYTALSQISVQEERFYLNKSIVALRKLLILDNIPKVEIVYYTLGKSYLLKGRFYADLALEYLRKAQGLGYENADIYEHVGEAFSILGNFEQSIENYEKALEFYDSDRLYLKIAEDCFNFAMYEKSANYYNILISETVDESLKKKGLFQLGKLYYDIKNLRMAKNTFEQLNELDPTMVEAHFLLGEVYFFMDENSEARREWHKTLRLDPEHRAARLRLYN